MIKEATRACVAEDKALHGIWTTPFALQGDCNTITRTHSGGKS